MPEHDDKNITEMRERLTALQRENLEIKGMIGQIAQANVLPGILQHGFDDVIAVLQPLRDLAPKRQSVFKPTADAVADMLAAMQGVASSSGSLGIPELNVPFIGEPRAVGAPNRPLPPVGPKSPDQTLPPNKQLYSRENRT